MSERYTRLYSLPNNLYLDGASVLIAAGALLKDNETGKILAQLKLQNLVEPKLIACKVAIRAFDTAGTELSGIESYSYLDMAVSRGENFGAKEPITLPDSATRKIIVSIIQVVFENGEIWQGSIGAWNPIVPHQKIENVEIQEQYSIEVGGNCEYIPRKVGDLFLCTCGAVNLSEYTVCSGCKRDAMRLISAFDIGELIQKRDLRLQQEREREAEERRIAEISKIKAKKKAQRISVVAVIVIMIALAVKFIVIPEIRYRAATESLETRNYDEAIDAFSQLGTYRESPNLLLEAEYQKACILFNEGDLKNAYIVFQSTQDYKDSNQQMKDITDSIYADAMDSFHAERYSDALDKFNFLRENSTVIDRIMVGDYINYCEVKLINFDDGKVHRLDEPYLKVISIRDESLKEQLMSIPQMKTVSRVEGGMLYNLLSTKVIIENGVIKASCSDGFSETYVLCFQDGEYGYTDESDSHPTYMRDIASVTEEGIGEQFKHRNGCKW